jgi:hypothetical protein
VLGSNSSAVESFLDHVYRLLQRISVFRCATDVKRELSLLCENGLDFIYLQSELKFSLGLFVMLREIYCTVGLLNIPFTSAVQQTQKTRFRLAVRTTFTKTPFCRSGSHTGYFFLAAENYGFKRYLLALKQMRTITQSTDD